MSNNLRVFKTPTGWQNTFGGGMLVDVEFCIWSKTAVCAVVFLSFCSLLMVHYGIHLRIQAGQSNIGVCLCFNSHISWVFHRKSRMTVVARMNLDFRDGDQSQKPRWFSYIGSHPLNAAVYSLVFRAVSDRVFADTELASSSHALSLSSIVFAMSISIDCIIWSNVVAEQGFHPRSGG